MKHFFLALLLLCSTMLYAQTGKPTDPANKNPNVKITPSINTTVTQQPASMPSSNTNPTTGTVISLKSKTASKTNKANEMNNADTLPFAAKKDSTLTGRQSKSTLKKKAAR